MRKPQYNLKKFFCIKIGFLPYFVISKNLFLKNTEEIYWDKGFTVFM